MERFSRSVLVAEKVRMHPVFVSLLQRILQQKYTDAVIVTTGLKQIWELILKKAGLSGVKVIGGSRILDRLVTNAEVEAAVVTQFKEHGLKTYAI
jgi:spore coat polysaccharide biosynthesis protein SpsF (cytidylyltransferase family)